MIEKLEIAGLHTEVSPDLHKYVTKKIGKLDRYIPKYASESAHAEVILKETHAKNKKECICEVVLYLPHDKLMTKEATLNMFAAVDIVEAKLKNQLKRYKEKRISKIRRRLISRFRH